MWMPGKMGSAFGMFIVLLSFRFASSRRNPNVS